MSNLKREREETTGEMLKIAENEKISNEMFQIFHWAADKNIIFENLLEKYLIIRRSL